MPKTRPPYPDEFRREAVELVRHGRSGMAFRATAIQSMRPRAAEKAAA